MVDDPTQPVPGGALDRKYWVAINRFRTDCGRCNYLMAKWNLRFSPICECGLDQTMSHIVDDCPIYGFVGGLAVLHLANDDTVTYLRNLTALRVNV